jgi:hypothetical protein
LLNEQSGEASTPRRLLVELLGLLLCPGHKRDDLVPVAEVLQIDGLPRLS